MTEPSGGPPDRMIRRRRLQFSLRGFLITVTVGCIWLGWKVETDRRQRVAINAIKAMGGVVTTA